jgi:hypothetical protein
MQNVFPLHLHIAAPIEEVPCGAIALHQAWCTSIIIPKYKRFLKNSNKIWISFEASLSKQQLCLNDICLSSIPVPEK